MNLLFCTSIHSVIRRLSWGASGRTSTAPNEAAGQRAAHSRAASSDGSSRMVNPPNCSLVSAYGPSCTPRFPSLIVIVVPVSGTSSGSPPTNAPDPEALLVARPQPQPKDQTNLFSRPEKAPAFRKLKMEISTHFPFSKDFL